MFLGLQDLDKTNAAAAAEDRVDRAKFCGRCKSSHVPVSSGLCLLFSSSCS